RTLIRVNFEKAFKNFQLLVGPSMPILPFKVGDKVENPLAMYMCDINTVPATLAGLPAISVPCGFHQGLPIGFQIMAPPFREDLLLQAAHSLEKTIS
ncbi:Asp-tRNA(Asn)/Glu-tRNA(Gln) amidotransferase subunit GatA, partial [bacterium]